MGYDKDIVAELNTDDDINPVNGTTFNTVTDVNNTDP